MNIKLTVLSAGIFVALSSAASAQPEPPTADAALYGSGPQSPLLNTTNLSAAERSAFALMEGVMQIAEAKIHATSCAAGTFDIDIYADGRQNVEAIYNQVSVSGANGSGAPQFTLNATPNSPVAGRGQKVDVALDGTGMLGTSKITQYNATFAYNNVNNMMVSNQVNIAVVGINGFTPDAYIGNVIKDFYHGATSKSNPEYYNIYDWGLQSVSKLGYPVNKWWQRSKTHRDDGVVGRTVWVKDRLVGSSPCRIAIDMTGYNNQNYFWQGTSVGTGKLTISADAPSATVPDAGGAASAWVGVPF